MSRISHYVRCVRSDLYSWPQRLRLEKTRGHAGQVATLWVPIASARYDVPTAKNAGRTLFLEWGLKPSGNVCC
jgi:hypothetical protein